LIKRKILKVKTIGSKKEGNLRPSIVDNLTNGLNLKVLEYDELNNECIVEVWGSDHTLVKDKVSDSKLNKISKDKNVLEEFSTHPKSGGYKVIVSEKKVKLKRNSPLSIEYKGKKVNFKRVEKDIRGLKNIVLEEVGVGE
jgi:hypothetical protein